MNTRALARLSFLCQSPKISLKQKKHCPGRRKKIFTALCNLTVLFITRLIWQTNHILCHTSSFRFLLYSSKEQQQTTAATLFQTLPSVGPVCPSVHHHFSAIVGLFQGFAPYLTRLLAIRALSRLFDSLLVTLVLWQTSIQNVWQWRRFHGRRWRRLRFGWYSLTRLKTICHFLFAPPFLPSQVYSEDSNSEPDVDLENQYYNSKALKEDDPNASLISFQKVLDLEGSDKGDWGFKALKQMIKINFRLVTFKRLIV